MKKLTLLKTISTSTFILIHGSTLQSSFASVQTSTPCFKSGFYAGAQTGWSRMRTKFNSSYSETGLATTNENQTTADNQVVLDAIIGGRYFWSGGLMAGVDVLASFAEHTIETRFSHGLVFAPPLAMQLKTTISRKNTLIPSLVVGWVVKNFYLFCKLGIGTSQFKTTIVNPNPAGETFTQTKRKFGFVPTIGVEYAINSTFSAVASISYENYGKISQSVTNVTVPAPGPGILTAAFNQYKPSIISGKVGIILKL